MKTVSPLAISSWQMTRSPISGEDDAPGFSMVLQEIPLPELKDGEVLVEIAGCGVCGTDIGYFYHGIPTSSRPPLVLGHEISGTVVSGDDAWLGKEVIVPTIIPCRDCELCRSGRANRCLRQRMPGNSYGVYGGFASHIPVPARELCPVSERGEHSLASLAVVADAVATPYQAAQRGEIAPGDRIIVVGVTGGLGTYMAQWAKALGAETVIGIGRNQVKLENSRQFGVDATICSAGKSPFDVKKEFFTECRRRKIDPKSGWKIFEMSGYRQGQEIALELIGYAGMLVIVGYGSDVVPYHLSKLMAFDAEIRGTWGCLPEHYPAILKKVVAGEIRIEPFVETRPMSSISATLEELRKVGSPEKRVVLIPDF